MPVLELSSDLDVGALIKLRNCEEAILFRDWIHKSQSLTEAEILELITGWRNRSGETLKSKKAKVIRWLISTGAGAVFGTPIGVGVGTLDNYLGKLLPGTGPIGFIERDYEKFIEEQNKRKQN